MEDLTHLDGRAWAKLNSGIFTMGSNNRYPTSAGGIDVEDHRELPPHCVTISSFRIARYSVTYEQYRQFVNETGKVPEHWSGARIPEGKENCPVGNVTWNEARSFCSWLTGKIGTGTADLPTEAQWEFAARGPEGREYPWGDERPDATRCGFLGSPEELGDAMTTPVDHYPRGATPTGVFGMVGNVNEWCLDWYAPYEAAASTDPTGPPVGVPVPGSGMGTERVIRGLHRAFPWTWQRGAFRDALTPNDWADVLSFRVVWRAASGTL